MRQINDDNWIDVKTRLPESQGTYDFISVACSGQSLYHPKYGFDYDNLCEESVSIAGVGTPDKITHWR